MANAADATEWFERKVEEQDANTSDIKFSIIAPNLNEAEYLPVFLRSLEHQTCKNWELILVDGGSTDGSITIAESWGKALITVDKTKNIGYCRNVGSKFASGDVFFHTSSDTYLGPQLLEKIAKSYQDPNVIAVTGRTYPLGTSIWAHLAYQLFDFLRYLFTVGPLHKFRPSGNFFTIRRQVFERVHGFPEVPINEDGLLGQKLDQVKGKVIFHLGLYVGHNVKRFEAQGGLKTIFFYLYVLGNLFPWLKSTLWHVERRSAETFISRVDLR